MSKNDVEREDRLKLSEKRDLMYEKFRTNLRILRSVSGLPASDASKLIGLQTSWRCVNLEYGKANPNMDEIMLISNHYKVSIDDLLNKSIKIVFE